MLQVNRIAASGLGAVTLLVCSAFGAPGASANSWTPANNPGVTVWEHGGSNMGECSAYLGSTLHVRDDINHVIKEFGALLGLSSPGSLYSVRARQATSAPPAAECLPRQLPGGGTG